MFDVIPHYVFFPPCRAVASGCDSVIAIPIDETHTHTHTICTLSVITVGFIKCSSHSENSTGHVHCKSRITIFTLNCLFNHKTVTCVEWAKDRFEGSFPHAAKATEESAAGSHTWNESYLLWS